MAVTGDRIEVLFRAGEAWMGEAVRGTAAREFDYRVQGWDAIKTVELVRDNLPLRVELPDYTMPLSAAPQRLRLRFEWGWGPMKGYQVFDWQGSLKVEDGRLLQGRLGWSVDELPTWIVAHRALPESLYLMQGRFADTAAEPAHYYLRVTQQNGQLAWSSPIWFED